MNRRIALILAIGSVVIIVFLAVYSNIIAGNNEKPSHDESDIDKLENSIIIHGLKMDSESPMADDESQIQDGAIIYDESFDDDIGKLPLKPLNKITKTVKQEQPTGISDRNEILMELKSRDHRWHTTRYRIKKGENLWVIAKKFHTSHELIIKVNDISRPDVLNPGRTITIPHRNGTEYVVKKGDSLNSIASSFGIPVKKVIDQNNMRSGRAIIRPGLKLFLPDAVQMNTEKDLRSSGNNMNRVCITREKKSFSWPLSGRITSGFGNRLDPFSRTRKFHCGIDISVDSGTPVKAADSGKVIFSGWKDGYGNMVVLKHENGYISVYAHHKNNIVNADDSVVKGDTIALSGMTGAVTGAHLHFEIRKYLTALNPIRLLR